MPAQADNASDNGMTAKWLEYYNRERPHSSLHNKSPLQYREESGSTLPANFWRDFSAPAQLATRRALAPLGPQSQRYKIAPKRIDIRGYRVI
ncbi:MAG: integrase core domain-containing protein [Akkermansia sp.]|nr:integrase core domain-containing protein [Akkermansia sp.]